MDQTLITLGVMVVVSVVLSVGLVALFGWLKQPQGYPYEDAVEKALLPFIYKGIFAAFKVSEGAVDEVGRRLEGADKKAIADAVYALLPDKIGEWDLTLVKKLVTKEQFETLVQNGFDSLNEFYLLYEGKFDEALGEWLDANQPVVDEPPAGEGAYHTL
jgi:hypothetical protein